MNQNQQLVREFNTLNMNTLKLNGLYLKLNNNLDYGNMQLMVIGPSNTPYVNGLYHFSMEFKNYPYVAPIVYHSSNSSITISPYININGTLNINYLTKWSTQSNLLLLINNIRDTIFITEPFANVIPINTIGNISVILDKYYNVLPLINTRTNFINLFYDTSKRYLLQNQNSYYYEINGLSGFNGTNISNIYVDTNVISYNFNQLITNLS
jgi:ubiquitin-protein ligase